MPLAHVAGIPAEELLPALAGMGGLVLLARGWMELQLRRMSGRACEGPGPARNLPVTLSSDGGALAMAVQTDQIERDVLIRAPVERVWELITSAEHLGTWFGDAGAEVDLRPGGALAVTWRDHHGLRGRVETVDPPRRFSWRWLHVDGEAPVEPTPANSTLVEFTLSAEEGGTRVTVVESGFDGLDVDVAARGELFASHGEGWAFELGELAAHAADAPAQR